PVAPLRPVDITNGTLPPALLFQATDDAAAPYSGGATVHRLLARSSLVVEEGGGNHGVTLSGNPCLDGYLAAYPGDGRVPRGGGAVDAVCPKSPAPTPPKEKPASPTPRGSAPHGLPGFHR
ncbi:alpha/beta hydrolase, partial [Streptomyces olivaceoviridis]